MAIARPNPAAVAVEMAEEEEALAVEVVVATRVEEEDGAVDAAVLVALPVVPIETVTLGVVLDGDRRDRGGSRSRRDGDERARTGSKVDIVRGAHRDLRRAVLQVGHVEVVGSLGRIPSKAKVGREEGQGWLGR